MSGEPAFAILRMRMLMTAPPQEKIVVSSLNFYYGE